MTAIDGSGGILDGSDHGPAQAEYQRRAQEHAPRTAEELRKAAQQLARDGHSERSIADDLRLDLNGIRRLIGTCEGCE